MLLQDAIPRTLPAKGGQLIEIRGSGLGYHPESFSVFIGGVPCLSLAIKDKGGKRMTCVSGAQSGTALNLRVEFASGVYIASRTANSWFRSALPNVAFINPSKATAGDTITIFGTGFGIDPSVVEARVADTPCIKTTLVSDIRAECQIDERIPAKSAITISVNGQSSVPNSACTQAGAKDTSGCVAPVDEPVSVTLVLDIEFTAIGEENSPERNSFVSSLLQELSAATGAQLATFSVASVSAGSVIVEVVISTDTTSFASLSPARVALKLKDEVSSATGPNENLPTQYFLALAQNVIIPAAVAQLVEAESKVAHQQSSFLIPH